MTCTRVLSTLGSHPQPSVDLAMCLSQSKPLYELLSMSTLKPQQHNSHPSYNLQRSVSLRSPSHSTPVATSSPSALPPCPLPWVPRSCFRRDSSGQHKKRVVFADAKGLALTAVRLFIPDSSIPAPTVTMKPLPVKLKGSQSPSNKLQHNKLQLGFPQPKLDLSFARLQEMHIQLESCNVSEHSMSGRVRVSHVSTEKTVHVKVTFDSWLSHKDIPCTFLHQQRFGSSEVDVYAFNISLPKKVDPEERIEFWVSLRPGPGTMSYWDDNNGQNYRVYVEEDRANDKKGSIYYYYPTFSKNQPPSWYSQVSPSMQDYTDPLYFQNSLPGRVIPRWEAVFS